MCNQSAGVASGAINDKSGVQFLPVRFIDVGAEGAAPTGALGLNYQVGLGNGRSSSIGRAGDGGDIHSNRAWVMNILPRPSRLSGLQIETPAFLGAFANVRHLVPQTGQIFYSQAYYIQVGYRLPSFEKKWKPYNRFEGTRAPAGEPVFDAPGFPAFIVPDLKQSTAGVRFDFSDFAAVKGEDRNTRRGVGEPSFHGAFFQTSVTFSGSLQ